MTSPGPRCFLHVPKSAGSSFHELLLRAYPEQGAVSPRRCDTTGFANFSDFSALGAIRATIAVDEGELAELAEFEVVSGHFAVPHLLQITTPDRIATIFREPRTRLISLYAYYRLSPWLLEAWHPYDIMLHGRRPLDEFLADESLAVETDNQGCRLLLHGDSRIPRDGFIRGDDVTALAASAVEKLDSFGLVGILEAGRPTWDAFGRFFELDAEPVRVNVTGERPTGVMELPPLDEVTARTIELLEERNAVDSLIYDRILEKQGWSADATRRLRDATLTEQMVRLGDIGGSHAVLAAELTNAIAGLERDLADLRAQLGRAEADLASHKSWLSQVQSSASWQLTSPLRTAKHAVRQRRGSR
jgi:hypothetical protein